jgi:hypothetical protein
MGCRLPVDLQNAQITSMSHGLSIGGKSDYENTVRVRVHVFFSASIAAVQALL